MDNLEANVSGEGDNESFERIRALQHSVENDQIGSKGQSELPIGSINQANDVGQGGVKSSVASLPRGMDDESQPQQTVVPPLATSPSAGWIPYWPWSSSSKQDEKPGGDEGSSIWSICGPRGSGCDSLVRQLQIQDQRAVTLTAENIQEMKEYIHHREQILEQKLAEQFNTLLQDFEQKWEDENNKIQQALEQKLEDKFKKLKQDLEQKLEDKNKKTSTSP